MSGHEHADHTAGHSHHALNSAAESAGSSCSGHGASVPVAAGAGEPVVAGKVKDPVCGMMVDPHTAKHRAEHNGRTYYFCSAGCRAKFEADPHKYLSPSTAAAAPSLMIRSSYH